MAAKTEPGGRGVRTRRGYTLVELLAVVGILAILAGIGFGFLRGGMNELSLGVTTLRDLVRAANTRSRLDLAGTRIHLRRPPAWEEEPLPMVLELVALTLASEWHFDLDEEGSARGVFGLPGEVLGGRIAPGGRHGNALFPDPDSNRDGFRAEIKDHPSFDLRKGFLVKLDLWLEERSRCIPLRLGRTLEITVDEEGHPLAAIGLEGPGGQVGSVLRLGGASRLPLFRWVRLETAVDGGRALLRLDGIELDSKPVGKTVFHDREAWLVLSDGGLPVRGRVDSLRIYGYEVVRRSELPLLLEVLSGPSTLYFDIDGRLDPRFHSTLPQYRLRLGDRTEVLRFEASGLIR